MTPEVRLGLFVVGLLLILVGGLFYLGRDEGGR